MKVVYTAPNRGHHYKYAIALNEAGCLHAFVSGFPRLNRQVKAPDLGNKLYHTDIIQTIYIASLKARLSSKLSNWLAFMSKIRQDYSCRKFIKDCDIFIFYNGSGLGSSRYGKKHGTISIVEAVNSHVEYQEDILEQEYANLGIPWEPFPKAEKARRIKEYEEADYILLPSEFVKNTFLEKGFPASKLLKVPYGFNSLAHSTTEVAGTQNNEGFTILFVGSISVRKGVRYLVEAFNQLQHPNKRLILAGPNTNDGALNGMVLGPDITFTGVLKGEQLANVYKSADIFCLPSIEEGLALVLGEALSYGLPIVTTCNTGADDIITDGVEGYILPIRNSKAIAQKLQNLADDPELLRTIRLNSYAKVAKLNGWKETGKNLVEILHKVHSHATTEQKK